MCDGDDNGALWKLEIHRCEWWVKEKARAIWMRRKSSWSSFRRIAWFVDLDERTCRIRSALKISFRWTGKSAERGAVASREAHNPLGPGFEPH